MEREAAIKKLEEIININLHELAIAHEVSVTALITGKVNKGWAGHVCERYLGIPLNSSQSPNFGSWELKSIPLKLLRNGQLQFKETMAITMIDAYHVARTPFEESHLLSKLKKAVCVARVVGKSYNDPTFIHSVTAIDLEGKLYDAVKADYDLVRDYLNNPAKGFSALSGSMGIYIQPRTKGAGHGSISRAFYARPKFLAEFIKL